uniref:NADH dehydrogenase subunit 4L n=1 Tax=Monacha cartusiana TaxID=225461 RepID=UPI0023D82A02|nr:NADH dehydrogenase subunit 4L [Monacha cartusiana]URP31098.1 NADH dehydrogenase subunit 4L [Monacha cartusiana]
MAVALWTYKKAMLLVLIGLEMLMFLSLNIILILLTGTLSSTIYFMMYLCFLAAGAAIGLSLLISISRFSGNDYISSLLFEKIPWSGKFIGST